MLTQPKRKNGPAFHKFLKAIANDAATFEGKKIRWETDSKLVFDSADLYAIYKELTGSTTTFHNFSAALMQPGKAGKRGYYKYIPSTPLHKHAGGCIDVDWAKFPQKENDWAKFPQKTKKKKKKFDSSHAGYPDTQNDAKPILQLREHTIEVSENCFCFRPHLWYQICVRKQIRLGTAQSRLLIRFPLYKEENIMQYATIEIGFTYLLNVDTCIEGMPKYERNDTNTELIKFTIGRSKDCTQLPDISIPAEKQPALSQKHLRIIKQANGILLEPLSNNYILLVSNFEYPLYLLDGEFYDEISC